jgi:large subunit ribosomal protein L30e
MNEKKLGKILREAVSNKKMKTGFKEVLQYLKGTKLIVLSTTLNMDLQDKIKKSAEENNIAILTYPGNSLSLGRLCNLSYGTSVVSLKNLSDEDMDEILDKKS